METIKKDTRTFSAVDRCRCGAGLVFVNSTDIDAEHGGHAGVRLWLCADVDAGKAKIVGHAEHDASGHGKAKWDGDNARVFIAENGQKHDAHRAAEVWILAEGTTLAFGCSTRPEGSG